MARWVACIRGWQILSIKSFDLASVSSAVSAIRGHWYPFSTFRGNCALTVFQPHKPFQGRIEDVNKDPE